MEILVGEEAIARLSNARVLVVGLGGVGSFAAEYLARAGVGHLTIVDGDSVEASNRNRQLPALVSTEGRSKADIMAERIKDINPEVSLKVVKSYMEDALFIEIFQERYDYAIDAIDTITPKLSMIRHCLRHKIRLVSSMGAGGRVDPSKVQIANTIAKSYNCPLAQQVRKKLKRWDVRGRFKVVFSSELVDKCNMQLVEGQRHKKSFYGTISYMPSIFGAFCASVAIRDLVGIPVVYGKGE
jgi:tRNA A37 threonylcarbamoyladenosine dehydratase